MLRLHNPQSLAATRRDTAIEEDTAMALPKTAQETTLTITDEETCRMAQELADLKGQPLADVITLAIYYRLIREKPFHLEIACRESAILANEEWDAEIHALIKRFNKDLRPDPSVAAHGEDLYDEDGLPI